MRRKIRQILLPLWMTLTVMVSVSAWAEPLPDARIVINIPSRTLWLYSGEKLVKYYPVGVGRRGFSTPLGKFKVVRLVRNPAWEHPYKEPGAIRIPPGAANPLGTRWIGFHPYKGGEYGIHGTDRPSSVGKFSSHGCVRMKVPDAEDLFDKVRYGTPVEVVYETVLIRPEGNKMRIVVYPDYFGRGMPSDIEVQKKIMEQYPNVQLDLSRIRQALKNPTQRFVEVGTILDENPLAVGPGEAVSGASE